MPIAKYDSAFGGKPGAAAKALAAMKAQYGDSKGESVFYATVNERSQHGDGVKGQVRRRRNRRRRGPGGRPKA